MEKVVIPTGVGIVATDSTTYATLAALLAAGKTAFPGLESSGLYPQSIMLTSQNAAGNAAGDEFTYATNVAAGTLPTNGTQVQGSGQQVVVPGMDAEHPLMIQSVAVISKKTSGDIISISAYY